MNIYTIAGLGADERLFSRLSIPKDYNLIHLPWQDIHECATLEDYAKCFISLIDTNKAFALMGVSFGGMICSVLSHILNPSFLILISSAANSKEIPTPFKLAGKTHLIDIFPESTIKFSSVFLKYAFGSKSSLLEDYIREMDFAYCKKASQLICTWSFKEELPQELPFLRIKGTKDIILPALKEETIRIQGAGHFAVYENAKEVSQGIEKFLKEL